MKGFKKILVLENDIEKQGLPNIIEDILEASSTPYDVWWWFSQSIRQHSAEGIQRFAETHGNTFYLSYPSFVGWDNSFEDKLHLFKVLKEHGIKLNIGICHYPNFFNYLVKKMYEFNRKTYIEDLECYNILKECVEFHNIYDINYLSVRSSDNIENELKLITWEDLSKYFFKCKESKKDKDFDSVKVLATGEIYPVYHVSIDKENINESYLNLYIEGDYNSKFKFSDLERFVPKPKRKYKPRAFKPKFTGRKIKILELPPIGEDVIGLVVGNIVEELDRKKNGIVEAKWAKNRGIWILNGNNKPVKLLDERGAREYKIILE